MCKPLSIDDLKPAAVSPVEPETLGPQGVPEEPAPAAAPPGETVPFYSIRLLEASDALCARCLEPTGTGPVGFENDEPICDLCMLKASPGLGMVLALVAVTREYASIRSLAERLAEVMEAMSQLGAFAAIFEKAASRFGPRRRIQLPIESEEGAS